jgi:hypothetical protein
VARIGTILLDVNIVEFMMECVIEFVGFEPFEDEMQTALFTDPVRTAL